MTNDLLFGKTADTVICYVRKTDTFARYMGPIHAGGGFVANRLLALLVVLLLRVSVAGAEPISAWKSNDVQPPAMSAWGQDLANYNSQSNAPLRGLAEFKRRFTRHFNDPAIPWNPWKKTLGDGQSYPAFSSDLEGRTISVPVDISDAALELQSVPMMDDLPPESLSWDQGPEDSGLTRPFSENDVATTPSLAGVLADMRGQANSLDFSGPAAPATPSKMEFSSANIEGAHPDLLHDSGDGSMAADDILIRAPFGPTPLIISPEPSVTALCGISALLFACRRWIAKR
jgi:hypothetical protein